jgi:transposase
MSVVRQAKNRPDKYPSVTKLLGRMSAKQAAIAIANKTARIAWAIMVHGGVCEAGHRAPQYRGGGVCGQRIREAWRWGNRRADGAR